MRTIKFEKMLTDLKKTIDRKEIDLLPPYVFTGDSIRRPVPLFGKVKFIK